MRFRKKIFVGSSAILIALVVAAGAIVAWVGRARLLSAVEQDFAAAPALLQEQLGKRVDALKLEVATWAEDPRYAAWLGRASSIEALGGKVAPEDLKAAHDGLGALTLTTWAEFRVANDRGLLLLDGRRPDAVGEDLSSDGAVRRALDGERVVRVRSGQLEMARAVVMDGAVRGVLVAGNPIEPFRRDMEKMLHAQVTVDEAAGEAVSAHTVTRAGHRWLSTTVLLPDGAATIGRATIERDLTAEIGPQQGELLRTVGFVTALGALLALALAALLARLLAAPAAVLRGASRLGRYVDVVLLGEGGMGAVYRGRDPDLDRLVAIKVVLDRSASFVERFRREAKAVGRLHHPNIVQVHDFGQDDAGHPYFVMELVNGRALDQILADRGRLTAAEVAEVLEQAAAGLQAAHDAGIIHRDIKPANLVLDGSGRVKVVDFGIAHLEDQTLLTNPAALLGTPTYISPEQVAAAVVDGRSDIYSLGVSCYHLLAGAPPFQSGQAIALALMHLNDRVPPLAERAPSAPPALVALIERMCEKDPGARPPSGKAIVDAVAAIPGLDPARGALSALAAAATATSPATATTGGVSADASTVDQTGPPVARGGRAGH